jgi:hypothetical protein
MGTLTKRTISTGLGVAALALLGRRAAAAGARTEAGVNRGSHDPGQDLQATLFVQAANVVLARRPNAAMWSLWPWIEQASRRLHRNMLAIAPHRLGCSCARALLSAKDRCRCRGRAIQARSGPPSGCPPSLCAIVADQPGRASDGGSEGMASRDRPNIGTEIE